MRRLNRLTMVVVGATLAAGLAAGPSPAEEQGEAKSAQDAMMESWMKAMTPGPEHARLAKGAGTWKLKTTSWMDPSQPPAVSESVSERRMILGGRYLEDTTRGSMNGMQFEGRGITGFDNTDRKYHAVWVDNFGTGVTTMTGTCEEPAHVCTLTGTLNDPMTGKPTTMRIIERWKDDDHSVMEFHAPGPDGKEMLTMRIESERTQ